MNEQHYTQTRITNEQLEFHMRQARIERAYALRRGLARLRSRIASALHNLKTVTDPAAKEVPTCCR